jgi:hypothetical protein
LDADPPRTWPHLDGAGPGVVVERPRGAAALVLRGGGVAAVEATTTTTAAAATGAVVFVPLSLQSERLVIFVGHQRWGAAHQAEAQLTKEEVQLAREAARLRKSG